MLRVESVLEMMKVRAAFALGRAALKFTTTKGEEKTKWNEQFQFEFVQVSRMYTYYDMYRCTLKQIALFKDEKLSYHLRNVAMLFAVSDLAKDTSSLLFESGYFNRDSHKLLKKALNHLLAEVRP
jgi:hypothetical protein